MSWEQGVAKKYLEQFLGVKMAAGHQHDYLEGITLLDLREDLRHHEEACKKILQDVSNDLQKELKVESGLLRHDMNNTNTGLRDEMGATKRYAESGWTSLKDRIDKRYEELTELNFSLRSDNRELQLRIYALEQWKAKMKDNLGEIIGKVEEANDQVLKTAMEMMTMALKLVKEK